MSLTIQKGFWQDTVIADTREKLTDLYNRKPDIFDKPKVVMLEYWQEFDGLDLVLGDKLHSFNDWFIKRALSPETLTRCTRSLKEDGIIVQTEEQGNHRQEQEREYRSFWGNEKRLRLSQ